MDRFLDNDDEDVLSEPSQTEKVVRSSHHSPPGLSSLEEEPQLQTAFSSSVPLVPEQSSRYLCPVFLIDFPSSFV